MEFPDYNDILDEQPRFDRLAKPFQANLPYHNEAHGHEASQSTVDQVVKCRENGVDINLWPLYFGMRGHDLGIDMDPQTMGFDEPEDYSAYLTGQVLKELQLADETIEQAQEIILITNPQQEPVTLVHKIARRADVINIGGEFAPFVVKSGLLWQEHRQLSQDNKSYGEWASGACKFLTDQILAPDLALGDFDRDDSGQSFFQRRARQNVARLGGLLSKISDVFESVPEPTEGLPYPDFAALLDQQGIR
ncbi:MAG TPA: hypothetical protein VLF39_01590 [Candidatus Saccharimonadales bacterium]|nr:hypothetical protein [Candidatus Saccharimonadales bacterium]